MNCKNLREISQYIYRWMKKNPKVNEESITDYFMNELSDKAKGVYHRSFDRTEEGSLTGADWEWWIVLRDGTFKFRVQAKKSIDGRIKFYHENNSVEGSQMDLLLKSSKKENFLPFYIYYTADVVETMCEKSVKNEAVYIASADFLKNLDKKSAKSSELCSKSILMSCLFCCKTDEINLDSKEGFVRLLNKYFPEIYIENKLSVVHELNQGYYKQTPNYVTDLMCKTEEIDLEYDLIYQEQIKDINKLSVFDMRKKGL